MEENIEEENVNTPSNPELENLPLETLPITDTQTNNSIQEKENMEVHHHAHHEGKKNWKSYFWEFLMLFLAVFCGFLAELQLEHVIEQRREKVLIASLFEDLKKDTASISQVKSWEDYKSLMDSLGTEIKKPSNQRNNKSLYRWFASMRIFNAFEYHDRTIGQLKNGGNFRLLTDKNLSDALIDYDTYIVSRLRDQEEQSKVIYQKLNFLQDKFINAEYYDLVYENEKKFDSIYEASPNAFRIAETNKDYVYEYYNNLHYFKTVTMFRIYTLNELKKKANNLIEQINKTHKLK